MRFNEKLQKLRTDRGLKLREVADTLYVSTQTVGGWEAGRNYPSAEMLIALSKLFNVSIDELLSEEIEHEKLVAMDIKCILPEIPCAEKIYLLRKLMSLSIREMAAYLSVSPVLICRWEAGYSLPKIPALIKISKLSGMPINELLSTEMK